MSYFDLTNLGYWAFDGFQAVEDSVFFPTSDEIPKSLENEGYKRYQ